MIRRCSGCGKRFANDATGGGWVFVRSEHGDPFSVCSDCKQTSKFAELFRNASRLAERTGSKVIV